jgi:ribose transport system substrate-binding protein
MIKPRDTRLLLVALLAAAIFASGCQRAEEQPRSNAPPARAANQRPRIALIMKSLANEFFVTMADGARKHQAEHSADYELVVNGIKDESDLAQQVALVEQMVASGVDAIVVAPADSRALVPSLRKAVNLEPTRQSDSGARRMPNQYCAVNSGLVSAFQSFSGVVAM